MDREALLSTQNLSVTLGDKLLFDHLNLSFKPGELWGLMGANGSGKTTLLHTLAGLKKPTTGSVLLENQIITEILPKARAKKIGLLFQEAVFPFPITVLDAALTGRYPYSSHWFRYDKKDQEIALKHLKALQIETLQKRQVSTLSGGEKQRLALALLFAQEPEIYLLDEPTNHLDLEQKIFLIKHLKQLAKVGNKIIIMSLHDVHLIKNYCDNLILLGKNKNHRAGKTNQILTPDLFNEFFDTTIF